MVYYVLSCGSTIIDIKRIDNLTIYRHLVNIAKNNNYDLLDFILRYDEYKKIVREKDTLLMIIAIATAYKSKEVIDMLLKEKC